jgi:DNA ligase D-like protein (predicted 3'-phosphoesterase)
VRPAQRNLFRTEGPYLRFVMHLHQATHLHYDLRLELNGKLLSWAVPKGPSLEPGVRRLAVPTHDHTLSCLTIEAGHGKEAILIWDQGFYEPTGIDAFSHEAPVREAYERGFLRFTLYGEKLRGAWTLRRMKDGAWLLEKLDDAFATSRDIRQFDRSVVSGRGLDDLTANLPLRRPPTRHILRIEVERFYAEPCGEERPLLVVRDGMVLDANLAARHHGVRAGNTLRDASNLIPNVQVRHWQADDYRERQEAWLRACVPFSDVIEPDDQHAAYLDLSQHPEPADIADRAVAAVAKASGLPVRFGAGPSKWIAALAAECGDWGLAVKDPEKFLAPLPVSALRPVSREARERMHFLGYRTVSDVAPLDSAILRDQFGVEALLIQQAATGVHVDPVREVYPPNSVAARVLFPEPVDSLETLDLNYRRLADQLGSRLNQRGLEGSNLELSREMEQAGWLSRTREFARPLRCPRSVLNGIRAVSGALPPEEPVSAVRVRLRNLKRTQSYQMSFAGRGTTDDQAIRLNRALTQLHTTFGDASVRRASEVPIERRVRVLREWQAVLGWR